MEEIIKNCPQCPRGCPIDEPQCGKGRAFAERLKNPESADSPPEKEGRHGHGHHGHDNFDPDSFQGLFHRVGHRVFHGEEAEVFACLTEQEKATLKELLQKIAREGE